jgi:hypothetical protein
MCKAGKLVPLKLKFLARKLKKPFRILKGFFNYVLRIS